MQRQHPFLSSTGFFATLLLLAGLGAMIWFSGGRAFSPGELSAKSRIGVTLEGFNAHADFEADCSRCHQPLATTQDVLCIDCHVSVAQQIQELNGTHGHIQSVNSCAACHSDHLGRDFDPTHSAFDEFDHAQTHFSLVWHQVNYDATPMACEACHQTGEQFSISRDNCTVCHAVEDLAFILKHRQDFGEDCTACHDGKDRMIGFDHQATAFPLTGKHQTVDCGGCHGLKLQPGARGGGGPPQDLFSQTPSACVECHVEPEVHQGMFSADCSTCHQPDAWSPAALEGKPFQHFTHTGFSLDRHRRDFEGEVLICNDCHQGSLEQFTVQTCSTCHEQAGKETVFISQHAEQFGVDCMSCHDGVDRMHAFDHARVFPLDGKHAEASCEACHADKKFTGTSKECVQCHAEPKIHQGFFGLQCQACHTAQAWAPARLVSHNFPLDHGGQGEITCQVCHEARYVEFTCYGCHDHQQEAITQSHQKAGVSLEALPNCTECHPTGLNAQPLP